MDEFPLTGVMDGALGSLPEVFEADRETPVTTLKSFPLVAYMAFIAELLEEEGRFAPLASSPEICIQGTTVSVKSRRPHPLTFGSIKRRQGKPSKRKQAR